MYALSVELLWTFFFFLIWSVYKLMKYWKHYKYYFIYLSVKQYFRNLYISLVKVIFYTFIYIFACEKILFIWNIH